MAFFEAQPLLCRKGVVSMSESTKLDVASDSASTASLKETNEERIVRDEGEMAAAGGDAWLRTVVGSFGLGAPAALSDDHEMENDFLVARPGGGPRAGSRRPWTSPLASACTALPARLPVSQSMRHRWAVLLGVVSYRVGKPLEWDAKALKVKGVPEADGLIKKAYRKGWEV